MPLTVRETPSAKMQTKRSAWTPLNHNQINNHVFEERRNLIGKWFDKWTDSQRKQVLQDFFSRCTAGQLKYLRQTLCSQVPEEALDFTNVLPHVISLYIFSYLDPRSLCRCAQVSWHWKSLVELDQLWMPKCLRLGWCITFTPTPFEQGVWKRHYVETVHGLHVSRPKTPAKEEFIVPEVRVIGSEMDELEETGCRNQGPSQRGRSLNRPGSVTKGLPPWRDSDRHPTDTIRFNYLENLDRIEQARSRGANPNTTTQENTKKKALSASSYRLRKAKSLMFLSLDRGADGKRKQSRPQWATQSLASLSASKDPEKRLGSNQWNAGIRPGPVRPPVPKLSEEGLRVSLRSHRSTPTVPLLEGQPWRSPASEEV
ncbi:F-box only protein 16 [Pygocentrus nattereri]|uniref:F-box domain-containing protein n=1 Tax=Pygocentrus nattereri TaxID=42514 RepID=A0A3B4BRU2_PYGNA|nr:F-box only protein 16 [Pygocentrus nattereri]XP_037394048.1 F-box only protein 16 [Pygocentrus nattereri]XP_037394049.1 F-box only protein 16 [Pygocentrus nattereri]XP_037394050.1 F-box only protein 16 [Pygocentrus nattereri]